MTFRVFLAVEGVNDGGALGQSPQARANDPSNEGALQPLVRRILEDEIEIRGQKTTMLRLSHLTDPAHATGRRVRQASVLAALDGCDVLVMHADVDATEPLGDAAGARTTVAQLIDEGFAVAERGGGGVPQDRAIACVPCRTIEAWLLADHEALRAAADDDNVTAERAVADPEALWGDNAAGTDHPKHVLRRALRPRDPRAATRDYRRLAESADLDRIESACPVSFAPFRRALLAAKAATGS